MWSVHPFVANRQLGSARAALGRLSRAMLQRYTIVVPVISTRTYRVAPSQAAGVGAGVPLL